MKITMMPLRQNFEYYNLSVVLSELILFVISCIFAVITIFTTIAQIIEIQFHTYVMIGILFIVITFISSIIVNIKYSRRRTINRDYRTLIGLIILACLSGVVGVVTLQQDEDDLYYVPNVVHYLEHPFDEMDYSVHFFVENDPPIASYGASVSIAYEYFQGIFAYITQSEFLLIYYHVASFWVGFILTLALFFALSSYTDDSYACLLGTMIILSTLLFLLETQRSYGSLAFIRFKHGKSVAMSVGIPTTIAFSLYYFWNRTVYYWVALLATFTAMTGLSLSSVVIFPLLSVVLIISYVVSNHVSIYHIRLVVSYFASQFLLVVYALFLLTHAEFDLGINSPISSGRYPEYFIGQLRLIVIKPFEQSPTLVIGIFAIIGIVLIGRGWQRKFLLSWIIATFLLFLNPISAELLMKYVTSQNIYWRLFYILPFPLIVGILAMQLYQVMFIKWRRWVGFLVTIGILASSFLVFYDNGLVQWHKYKYPQFRLRYARQIIGIVPLGSMLAPLELGNTVPILSSGYPQYSIKGGSTALFLGSSEKAELRDAATHFVTFGGEATVLEEFLQLEQPTSIVISVSVVGKKATRHILETYQYTEFKRLDDLYFVYWQSLE